MSEIKGLTQKITKFRDDRDWKQFHSPKDIAISLALEAGEVLEHFQWRSASEVQEYAASHRNEIAEELADVLYWVLLMSHDLEIDIKTALEKKLVENEKKYPKDKTKGRHTKYTDF